MQSTKKKIISTFIGEGGEVWMKKKKIRTYKYPGRYFSSIGHASEECALFVSSIQSIYFETEGFGNQIYLIKKLNCYLS